MRPVDLLLTASHDIYDGTFENDGNPGVLLLKLGDYAWKNNNEVKHDGFLDWFLNGFSPLINKPAPQAPPLIALHIFPNNYNVNPRNLPPPWADRDGGPLNINTRIYAVQLPSQTQRLVKLRLALPPDEAANLVSAWKDAKWNLANPASTVDLSIKDAVQKVTGHTDTVPSAPEEAGKYCGYRGAIQDLEAAIGGYCSFCEAKRQDSRTLEVEHRLAKASYQSEILRWSNFLCSCSVCNTSFKQQRPNRKDGIEKAIRHFYSMLGIRYPVPAVVGGAPDPNISPDIPPGLQKIPYSQMRQVCDWYYLWPSLDDGGTPNAPIAANPANPTNYSLTSMCYRMREYTFNPGTGQATPGNWIGDADSVHLNNKYEDDGNGGTTRAVVWDSSINAPRTMLVRVEVEARNPGTGSTDFDARKQRAAESTIDMVGLNRLPNAAGDRRMLQRTKAWFDAISMLGNLNDQLARLDEWRNSWSFLRWFKSTPGVDFDADQWNIVASTAEAGYYSIWITVFARFSVARNLGDNLAVKLAERLHERAVATMPYRYKGTNLINSVVHQIPLL